PQNTSELARSLGITSPDRAELRQLVDQLEKEGSLIRLKKSRYALKNVRPDLIEGRIKCLRSGRCIFIPDKGSSSALQAGWDTLSIPEIDIPPFRLHSAMDGDRVAVKLERTTPRGWSRHHKGRPQLEEMDIKIDVQTILKRNSKQWIGVFRPARPFGKVLGDGQSSPACIELTAPAPREVAPGQIVTVEPISWGEGRIPARGKMIELIGWADDPHVDMETVIRKYQIPTAFPEEVLDFVNTLTEDLDETELSRREDWSNKPVMTIDPEGARDFDDAIHVVKTKDGWELAVHIADVSHYVQEESPLDKEAIERGNSTYLPDRVLPMLPPRLCDDLCSLRANVIRLTKVCVMDFNTEGKRIKTRFADAYIRNQRQMTYPDAITLLRGNGTDDISQMVKEAWNLASILRKKRFTAGALDLDFPEARVLMDDLGHVTKIVTEEYDESHQLIEECMLAANEAVAETLKNKNRPTIYRIHEDPNEAKLNEFAQLCRIYGHDVHNLDIKKNLTDLMVSIKDSPDAQVLKLALLKSLMRARYDTEPLGHYGLSKTNYCHFTSPIRRYADLVVHRSLNPLLSNPPPHSLGAGSTSRLQEIADHISETERRSSAAEKESNRIKLFEWLDDQSHSDTPEVLMALVSEVRNFGLLIEIPRLQIRGMIKQNGFPRGNWTYESFANRWAHDQNLHIYTGTSLPVIPLKVDREKQWADFAVTPDW
ncbi:MAG: VacB/RNase II family 3'-5' exoribonuclease, partial [Akkermansia sp.]